MRRIIHTSVVVSLAVFLLAPGFSQQFSIPSPESTLTVSVTGAADSEADWLEVNMSVQGTGLNAQEALAGCLESCDAAAGELDGLGIPEECVSFGPPEISTGGLEQMMGMGDDDGEQGQYTVSRSLVVRLTEVNQEALYEDVCTIIDTAVEGGATLEADEPWSTMMASQGVVTFGVDDPKALRATAIADGLTQATEVAAAASRAVVGRDEVKISSVSVQEYTDEGLMGMVNTFAFPRPAGRAVYRVLLTVTYQFE